MSPGAKAPGFLFALGVSDRTLKALTLKLACMPAAADDCVQPALYAREREPADASDTPTPSFIHADPSWLNRICVATTKSAAHADRVGFRR
jgi:hypothetical protein